jgi:hypothetical protein
MGAASATVETANRGRDVEQLGRRLDVSSSPGKIRLQVIPAELSGGDICTAAGTTARGSAPVLILCQQLLAAGVDPDQSVEVFRNGILALTVRRIGEGARLRIAPQRLPECTGASPVRSHEAAATAGWAGAPA